MADGREGVELVYCHACENEWYRDQSGLECPQCHSDAVEVIDQNNDPRNPRIDLENSSDDEREEDSGRNADRLPHHPLHGHNPWANDVPDPDEGDIEHVAFNPAPGIHFQRTTFRSTSPPGQNARGVYPPLFTSFASMLHDGAATDGVDLQRSPFASPGGQTGRLPRYHSPFPPNPHGNPPFRTNVRVFGAGDQSINSLHSVLQTMLASIQANAVHPNSDNHGPINGQPEGNPFDFILQTLAQMHDPTRAAHGDAVFSDEALDHIISQMMDQQGGVGSAPGPATPAAIAALPKKPADKDMVGTDGKAECSVCMDAVLLGDEVTVLPCKHWFHGECVGAWLKEHDTCPHCRQGIMPKSGPSDGSAPGSPDQPPRNNQNVWTSSPRGSVRAWSPVSMPSPGQMARDARRRTRSASQNDQRTPSPQVFATPGARSQPGMQQPYIPGGYPTYPEPQEYVQPPFNQQHSPRVQQRPPSQMPYPATPPSPRARRQGSSRGSSSGSGNGEGSSSSAGSRVTGWFRNLRGGGNNEQR